jgi:hypothetical protein
MKYLFIDKNMTNDEMLEYWFIKLVGASDNFEFIDEHIFDEFDTQCDDKFIKCSDSDNLSFISFTESKSFICFDFFTLFF